MLVDIIGSYDLVALGIFAVTEVQGKNCCDLRE
jgi:hypothetical protein